MNLTRRMFLVSLAVCTLSACSAGGSIAPASDKWHTFVVEGLQISVPSDAKMDDEVMTFGSTDFRSYSIKGADIWVAVAIQSDGDITGDYDIRDVNGITLYIQRPWEDTTIILLQHDGKFYEVSLYFDKDTGTMPAYEAACNHLIESLKF